jgi:uncharacterized protein (TIRG00374 family)
MPKSTSQVRARWNAVAIAALTLGLLWFFFRHVDLAGVWFAIRHAHVWFIVGAVAATMSTYVFRTWRWQALLTPIGHARFRPAFRATVIGFTANNLLPGRIGEVLRPYLLARQENLGAAAAFATVIIERLLDLVTVLLLFVLFLWTADVAPGSAMSAALHDAKIGGALAAAAALGALLILFLCAGHPERLGRWAGRVTAILPNPLARATEKLVHIFAEGLAVMRRPGPLALACALSVPVWLSISLGIWLVSHAFDLTLPFTGSFLVAMYLVVGVAVPSPSGVGTFHWAYRLAVTTFFGASQGTAVAAALVLHAVSFLPVSLVGLIFIGQEGLTLAGLQRMKATAEAAEQPK